MVSNDIVAQLAVKVVNVKYWIYMLDVLQNWLWKNVNMVYYIDILIRDD